MGLALALPHLEFDLHVPFFTLSGFSVRVQFERENFAGFL
jgi:hypothetical protein